MGICCLPYDISSVSVNMIFRRKCLLSLYCRKNNIMLRSSVVHVIFRQLERLGVFLDIVRKPAAQDARKSLRQVWGMEYSKIDICIRDTDPNDILFNRNLFFS